MDQIWTAIRGLTERLDGLRIYQKNISPKEVKRNHIDGLIVTVGNAADRPADGAKEGIMCWFSEDTNVFSIWNRTTETWVSETLT